MKLDNTQNKKIKVLFRHRSMEMGGVEKVLLSMLDNLDRNKFDISLCLNLNQGELRNTIPSFIPTTILARGKEDFPKNKILNKLCLILRGLKLALYRKFPFIVDRFILKNEADIEIATGYTMFSDVLNSSNKKSKKIGWFHTDIANPKLTIVPKLLQQIPQFDYFIFGSQQAQDSFHTTFPNTKLPPNSVVLNAIDQKDLEKKAKEYEPELDPTIPTFVAVGRLHFRKGHHTLLKAHHELIQKGYYHRILVIGDGEEKESLEKAIKTLGAEETFILKGSLTNPYPYIRHASYMIMPSQSEGWPLVVAEALALRKPILATNVGGIPEIIQHKINGLLVSYSEESIFEGMKTFLTDTLLLNQIQKHLDNTPFPFDSETIFTSVEKIISDTHFNTKN